MGFNITEIVESKGWKKFMAKLYGWGAAVVIIGALFKIMHWPGAGPMLVVGLGTEAVIFFFSAFEPLHEEIDWSLVYPELAGMHDDELFAEEKDEVKTLDSKKSALEKFDEMINNAELTPGMFEKLGLGLKNLNETTTQISKVSNASIATEEYVTNIKSASSSFNKLTDSYSKSVGEMNENASLLSNSYTKTAELVSKSGANMSEIISSASNSVAEKIISSGSNLANNITEAGASISKTYADLAQSLKSGSGSMVETNKSYTEQLEFMTKNLSALNAVYELQLQGTNEQLKASEQLYSGVNEMMANLKSSVEDTKRYKEEVSKLGQNLAALNTVYGNMLAAMNVGQRMA
ncbi:MAG TPA: gliding motility protein GldL [Bacteroidales bacterium]|nr:MAG: hypothetical protein A2W98_03450 [Bacteroidetes bacterium GWF2_33_38]OFY67923.1 MAG: hypothetical protein A2265_03495 [Bacteroidetes bacterium RIFOXYA12_FULL_33_9]OFY85275.1 MAG: hypothetical protein A2236_11310 [Bacteroidetes bacterium RIFOXYA2_FULL_33_7]HBF87473.1 gliding motility protein GldL [Bacteroidales bacterium]